MEIWTDGVFDKQVWQNGVCQRRFQSCTGHCVEFDVTSGKKPKLPASTTRFVWSFETQFDFKLDVFQKKKKKLSNKFDRLRITALNVPFARLTIRLSERKTPEERTKNGWRATAGGTLRRLPCTFTARRRFRAPQMVYAHAVRRAPTVYGKLIRRKTIIQYERVCRRSVGRHNTPITR